MNYSQAVFYKSVNVLSQLPKDSVAEIAFAGRSNAGKSSALNVLTNIKGLAKTSKTPGRTQLINYFELSPHKFLVDLPGYGFAKVPFKIKEHWNKLLSAYLETRNPLRGVVLLMDIRHPLKEHDQQMIDWLSYYEVPMHILLTKADKLNASPAQNTLQQVRKHLATITTEIEVQLFSSLKRQGLEQLKAKLDQWFVDPLVEPVINTETDHIA
jgi:GTP-binding protein